MSNKKCSRCGLVNFASADTCRRCGADFLGESPSPAAPPDGPPPGATYAFAPPASPAGYPPPPEALPPYNAPPGYDAPAGPYGPYPPPPARPRDGMAITSMVLGIVGFFCAGLLGVGALTGLVLGIVAVVKANKNPGVYGGTGFAVTGIVLNGLQTVVVPAIILAVAIPNLMASRIAANEAAALDRLRTIALAQATYQSTAGLGRDFATLDQLAAQGLIDSAAPTQYGYRFTVKLAAASFEAIAMPVTYGSTGRRSFYVSADDYVMRETSAPGVEPTRNALPIEVEDDDIDYRPPR